MSSPSSMRVVADDLPAGLVNDFADARRVAWDVETSGLDWRADRLGTCQLYADAIGVVVVSVGAEKPSGLAALLTDPAVVKVFHHAPFDLRFMTTAWHVRPASIRCTKVASKLLDPGAPNETHSLQQLVSRHLGISLTKGAVRTSNWSAVNLTAEQLEYAAADVRHLLVLLDVLERALGDAGLAQLYDDCCAYLPARVDLELGDYPDVFAY